MAMGVKADKTFEEIVERLAALFKLKPSPGERDYEASIHTDVDEPAVQKPSILPPESPKDKK